MDFEDCRGQKVELGIANITPDPLLPFIDENRVDRMARPQLIRTAIEAGLRNPGVLEDFSDDEIRTELLALTGVD